MNLTFLRSIVFVAIAAVGLPGCVPAVAAAPPPAPQPFNVPDVKNVIVVVLENEDADAASRQPFFQSLAARGATFQNYFAIAKPSQPNYIALTSGSTHGVHTNNRVDLDVKHLGDLLEAKNLAWKVYAEGFPGKCFLGMRSGMKADGEYVRRHVPFLSYVDVQKNPKRCASVVDAAEFDRDIAAGSLPAFALYVPNNRNNGHDTGVRFAAQAMERRFGALLQNPAFLRQTLFVITFDEGLLRTGNRIMTVLVGDAVKPGSVARERYDHYDLLRTIEEIFRIGTLGLEDAKATPIVGVWK